MAAEDLAVLPEGSRPNDQPRDSETTESRPFPPATVGASQTMHLTDTTFPYVLPVGIRQLFECRQAE